MTNFTKYNLSSTSGDASTTYDIDWQSEQWHNSTSISHVPQDGMLFDFDDGEPLDLSEEGSYTFAVVILILDCISIFCNMLVIVAYIQDARIRIPKNYYIFNLAVTDLVSALFSVPFYTSTFLQGGWPFGHIFCSIWTTVNLMARLETAFTIVLITHDRYLLVKNPLYYHSNHRHGRQAVLEIIASWILTCLLQLPFIIFSHWWVTQNNIDTNCAHTSDIDAPFRIGLRAYDISYTIFSAMCEYILPLSLIIYWNLFVYHRIRKRSRQVIHELVIRTYPRPVRRGHTVFPAPQSPTDGSKNNSLNQIQTEDASSSILGPRRLAEGTHMSTNSDDTSEIINALLQDGTLCNQSRSKQDSGHASTSHQKGVNDSTTSSNHVINSDSISDIKAGTTPSEAEVSSHYGNGGLCRDYGTRCSNTPTNLCVGCLGSVSRVTSPIRDTPCTSADQAHKRPHSNNIFFITGKSEWKYEISDAIADSVSVSSGFSCTSLGRKLSPKEQARELEWSQSSVEVQAQSGQNTDSRLAQCWDGAADADPTLSQPRTNASCKQTQCHGNQERNHGNLSPILNLQTVPERNLDGTTNPPLIMGWASPEFTTSTEELNSADTNKSSQVYQHNENNIPEKNGAKAKLARVRKKAIEPLHEKSHQQGHAMSPCGCRLPSARPAGKSRERAKSSCRVQFPRSTQRVSQQPSVTSEQVTRKNLRRALFVLTIITIVFFVCRTPYVVARVLVLWCTTCLSDPVYEGMFWLGWALTLINPFLYAFVSVSFRHYYSRLLHKVRRSSVCCHKA